MLTAVREQQREQRKIAATALPDVRRAAKRGNRTAALRLSLYQAEAVSLALGYIDPVLSEQGISTASAGNVNEAMLRSGPAAANLLDKAATPDAFDRIVLSLLADSGRSATTIGIATRPAVTGYVRQVSSPCCSRCAILAGRVYRYSQGFRRHPRCDCFNVPTTISKGGGLTTNPDALFRAGQIRGLSRADTRAVNEGADLGQVVNVRRKAAGLSVGSSVIARGGRPTPEGIFRIASDRGEVLRLLRRFGYVL